MGASASKAARTAGTATRKYPSRVPPTTATQSQPKSKPPPGATNISSAQSKPPAQPAQDSPGPSVYPDPQSPYAQATSTRNEAVNLDSQDPDLALNERMRQLGPVQPNPTYSNSSTFNTSSLPSGQPKSSPSGHSFTPSASSPLQTLFPSGPNGPASNPAVLLLAARQRLSDEADLEFEDVTRLGKGKKGRQFLDVSTIRQIIRLRDEMGRSDSQIEEGLGLREGSVQKLGKSGIVSGP